MCAYRCVFIEYVVEPALILLLSFSMPHVIEDLERLYESIGGTASRSCLEPYREVILRWRRKRPPVSYRRILQALAAEGVIVTVRTLYEFVQRRSRPRFTEPTPASVEPMQPEQFTVVATNAAESKTRRCSPHEILAMRAAARADNHRPSFQTESVKPVFTYDPDRPLTNKESTGERPCQQPK